MQIIFKKNSQEVKHYSSRKIKGEIVVPKNILPKADRIKMQNEIDYYPRKRDNASRTLEFLTESIVK